MSQAISFNVSIEGIHSRTKFTTMIPDFPWYWKQWTEEVTEIQLRVHENDFTKNQSQETYMYLSDGTSRRVTFTVTESVRQRLASEPANQYIRVFKLNQLGSSNKVFELIDDSVKIKRMNDLNPADELSYITCQLRPFMTRQGTVDIPAYLDPPPYSDDRNNSADHICETIRQIHETNQEERPQQESQTENRIEIEKNEMDVNVTCNLFRYLSPTYFNRISNQVNKMLIRDIPFKTRSEGFEMLLNLKFRNTAILFLKAIPPNMKFGTMRHYQHRIQTMTTTIKDDTIPTQRECLRIAKTDGHEPSLLGLFKVLFLLHKIVERTEITEARHEKCTVCVNCLFKQEFTMTLKQDKYYTTPIVELLDLSMADDFYSSLHID